MTDLRDDALQPLTLAIAAGDDKAALRLLAASPGLAKLAFSRDGERLPPKAGYVGDTALHVAAGAYNAALARKLLALGAEVSAQNRRGHRPLHWASVGNPETPEWNPPAQVKMIDLLIEAGADPDAADKAGATPLHRAVRTRCSAAVETLLAHGASLRAKNAGGSTPADLATLTTGRGGAGSDAAKAEQALILAMLKGRAAKSR